jgi:hypothetical protein
MSFRFHPTVRLILPAELPTVKDDDEGVTRTATAEELRNMGIMALGDDLYCCMHQERSDDGIKWYWVGQPPCGTEISRGFKGERYHNAPAQHKAKLFRARVHRYANPAKNLKADLEKHASVKSKPENEKRFAMLDRVRELKDANPDVIETHTVRMIDVKASDVVESDNHVPHHWQGEPGAL